MKNDISFTIATAPHRYSKSWKHTETTWFHLLNRLSETTRTGETMAEYKKFSKKEKDLRKDVGGFVCGRLKDGKRLKQNVLYRQVITLDADTPGTDFLNDVDVALGEYAYAVYSTHSHTPERPRLRILIPLSDNVGPGEYQAIARRLASDIDIDAMDCTTYEPERLMYWPSTPIDGDYVFESNDGNILNPADVLKTYDDWRDTSTWPTSKKEAAIIISAAKKQGDPLEKDGFIGAFCRAYTIQDAIKTFLTDVYTPCATENRYTFIHGSTSAGLVVYDDKFAYSHHSTDPASMKLCNAFDLVRIHRFGDLDSDINADTPGNKKPSFLAMIKFVGKDKATIQELGKSQKAEIVQEFNSAGVDVDTSDMDWMDKLERSSNKDASILPTAANFIIILENDPLIAGHFGLDTFAHRLMITGNLPWRQLDSNPTWQDADDACLRNYLSNTYQITGRQTIDDALTQVMIKNQFHPVRDYLNHLSWDGEPRAASILVDWLGAENSKYVLTVTMTLLKAAVARVMIPGVKFDPCLVLSGPQGIGKSTVLRMLGCSWFNDSIVSFQGKDAMEQLQGSWIIELSEMQATNKSENDQIKAYISRQSDRFRAPYGRRTEDYPRQCVFTATTNDFIFLKDRTGGRRFWPVFCKGHGAKSLDELTCQYIDQVWAEVYQSWKHDGNLLLPADVAKTAIELQQEHTEGNEKVGLIIDYLDKRLPAEWNSMDIFERKEYLDSYDDSEEHDGFLRDKVCSLEIWCEALGGTKATFKNANAREINAIMQNMPGWKPANGIRKFGNLYGRQRCFNRVGVNIVDNS